MKFPRVHDATITRADFVRRLPAATGEDTVPEIDGEFRGPGWRIRLIPLAPMGIGSVRLERHRVEIAFEGADAAAQEAFMTRFTMHYQRGGG